MPTLADCPGKPSRPPLHDGWFAWCKVFLDHEWRFNFEDENEQILKFFRLIFLHNNKNDDGKNEKKNN
jgi:hypothetical protein